MHTLVSRGGADGKHPTASTKTVNDINSLRKQFGGKLIWTTGPGIDSSKILPSQKDILTEPTLLGGNEVFHKTCGDFAESNLPCLDMRHLTSLCVWSNCSAVYY